MQQIINKVKGSADHNNILGEVNDIAKQPVPTLQLFAQGHSIKGRQQAIIPHVPHEGVKQQVNLNIELHVGSRETVEHSVQDLLGDDVLAASDV